MNDSTEPRARTSARDRYFGTVAAIKRHEMPAVAVSFCLFFCVMAGYFAVRPVRETVGSMMTREALADLWTYGTWPASVAVIPIYGALVARFRRTVFLPWMYASVAFVLAFVGIALQSASPPVWIGAFFWVFLSVLNLFIISVFWSFLLELFRTDQTKRLFGFIAAGGTAGALAGPLFTDFTVRTIGNSGVLFTGAALFVGAIVCQQVLLGLWTSQPQHADVQAHDRERPIGGNPLAGFTIVLRSPYLLAVALFVVLLATATTFLYFEQLRLVADAYPEPEARTRIFARLDWVVQSLTIVSQLLLTGFIASRFGLVALLSMVPIAMVAGFLALAVWNTFAVFVVVMVSRRFGEYAFVRPGREMLFSRLDRETKYKAKNLIDVPVYRGADALAAQVQTGVEGAGFGPQTIAVMGVVTAAMWAVNGWWLGRRHDAAGERQESRVGALRHSTS